MQPVQALKELIESDRFIWNLFQMMFDEIPVEDVDTPAGTLRKFEIIINYFWF